MELTKLLWNCGAAVVWAVFKNKKQINYIPSTVIPFKNYKEKFAQCMELIDPTVKPYRIVTTKKDWDKVAIN